MYYITAVAPLGPGVNYLYFAFAILFRFRDISEIISRFRQIISRFREIVIRFREILFRDSRNSISRFAK